MQPYSPYLTPQQQNSYAQALQNQIGYLQQQLQQYQNPPMVQPQQTVVQNNPIQQNTQNAGISTQLVEDFENISANSVPMDNNGALFVKRDGTEIQSRRWSPDGKIITTSYLPVLANNVQNDTPQQIKSQNEALDGFTEVFTQRFDGIENRLDLLEQLLSQKTTNKSTRSTKKEAELE